MTDAKICSGLVTLTTSDESILLLFWFNTPHFAAINPTASVKNSKISLLISAEISMFPALSHHPPKQSEQGEYPCFSASFRLYAQKFFFKNFAQSYLWYFPVPSSSTKTT